MTVIIFDAPGSSLIDLAVSGGGFHLGSPLDTTGMGLWRKVDEEDDILHLLLNASYPLISAFNPKLALLHNNARPDRLVV